MKPFVVDATEVFLNIPWWSSDPCSATGEHKTTCSGRPHLPGSWQDKT